VFRPRVRHFLAGIGVFALALVGVQFAATAASADPVPQAATVYYYAYGYQSETAQAAQIWNGAVPNLNMVENGSAASITVEATTGGGSRAYPCGLGCASIYIDSQDVAAGHMALRIVTHEIGHGHGLPDNYNGDCNILMSGGSAGTSCRNPYPSSGEAAEVNSYYSGGRVAVEDLKTDVYAP
jgi:snapalysin